MSYRFYIDNIHVYEDVTGRLLIRQALGPTVANPNGIYWIDCGGNKLVDRAVADSRHARRRESGGRLDASATARSTWSPATPGYPALLVNGDFTHPRHELDR